MVSGTEGAKESLGKRAGTEPGSEDVRLERVRCSCAPLPRKERKNLSASLGRLQRQFLRDRLEFTGYSRWVRMLGLKFLLQLAVAPYASKRSLLKSRLQAAG